MNMPEQLTETPLPPAQPVSVELEKKPSWPKVVVLLVLVLVLAAAGLYFGGFFNKFLSKPCSTEAMICPDGTSVWRTGPNCELAPCPGVSVSPTSAVDATANWKTYEGDGFSFKYPENLISELNNQVDYSEVSIKDKDKLQLIVKRWTKYPVGQKDFLLDTSSNGEKKAGDTTWKAYSLPNGYCDMGSCTLPIFGLQTEKNGALYSLLFYGQSSTNNLSDQILSTFKFLEESTFGQEKTGLFTVKKSDYSIDGVSFDPDLYELKNEGIIAPGPEDDSYLFAKSSSVDLNGLMGKKVRLKYHYDVGDIRSEQRMVIVDAVE